jgi:mRNA interferase RelE/StbE
LEGPEKSGSWEVILSKDAAKVFTAAAADLQSRLTVCFDELQINPLGGDNIKKLTGNLKGRYRYRVGGWRVIYRVEEETRTVAVSAILPRGSAYKK